MTEPAAPLPPSDLDAFWRALVACRNDLPALLRVVADQVVAVLGDGCVLTTVTDDGTALQPRIVVHADPDVAQAMEAVLASGEVRLGEGVAGTVAADRRSIVLNDLAPDALAEATPARFVPFVRAHPIRALTIVPLVAAGQLVGTLGAVRTESAEPYSIGEVRMLEALAERAALAVAEAVAGPRGVGAADFEALYRHSHHGVLITTPDGHILAANPSACTILGLSEPEITRRGREGLLLADDPRLGPALAERAASGRARTELAMRRGDGTVFVADVASAIYSTPDGKPRACVIFRDISEEVAAREQVLARMTELSQLADRDDLTGLLNRRGFAVAAQQALAAADRAGAFCQLLFVDVDGLKSVNDAHGHAAGDAAIIAVAAAVDAAIRDVDVAARLSGDEFVVLLVEALAEDVPPIVERIRDALAHDAEAPPGLAISVGVVERPARLEATLAELVDAADRDMYQHRVLRRLRATD